jgi:Fe-S-cluster-containing dehydrogenase component
MSTNKKIFWRSLEEKANPDLLREASCGSDVVKQTVSPAELLRLNRRNFMTLGGAVSLLTGIEGCVRRPVEKILPFTEAPEQTAPGIPAHYATVIQSRGDAVGLLVTCHDGRPTKIEGNPEHPASRGAADLLTQAAVLDLYDPDRAREPSKAGFKKSFAEVDAMFGKLVSEYAATQGAGLHVLMQPTNSPSVLRLRETVTQRMPSVRFHVYSPLNESAARAGSELAFGRPYATNPHFDKAKVVLSVDCDFMHTEQGSVRASADFAAARRLSKAGDPMNRLYAVEPTLSVTGSNADHRLRLPAGDAQRYLMALAAELAAKHGAVLGPIAQVVSQASSDGFPPLWIQAVAKDLAANRGAGLIVAGSRQPAAVHALVHELNRVLGNAGRTVTYSVPVDPTEPDQFRSITELAEAIGAGKVKTLLILGGNPAYDAPADLGLAGLIERVPVTITFSGYRDETGVKTMWHVPRAHELESWGDQLAFNGQLSVQQPLIAPLWGGRTDIEVLAQLAGEANWRSYEQVKKTVRARGHETELAWSKLVQRGIEEGGVAAILGSLPIQEGTVASALKDAIAGVKPDKDSLEVVFLADNKLADGRHANNSWLLEMPDPITRIVWDNVAFFSPSTAGALGLENGDMVKIELAGRSVSVAVWKLPGQAANSIGLPLGWGRTRAGKNHNPASGETSGFNVYPLRSSKAPHFAQGAKLTKLDASYKVVQTQDHDSMEGRPVAIETDLAGYEERPNFPEYLSPDPSVPPLWKEQDYSEGYQWGMVIDLNACNGCNACVIACQSENNVPVVGKDQVSRGREMHWFRIDRYFAGDADEPEVAFQPIGCQHCEIAPCENVCPVNATAHSPEGLNDIAYNRCIGTRYCMNNCPYKVRRFNFLNFNLNIPESRKMQFNPNVSVRFRGVIEKCSYCVQRIEGAKIASKREDRKLHDGEVVSACQQTCPTGAIAFGDINDPNSQVSRQRNVDRNYALLAEIGTKPRTRFLGKVRNPNPEMQA